MGYPGGKNGAGVYQTIINLIPPHAVYIEPFLGGGAVMRLKRPAAVNVGLDLDAGAVRRFRRWLQERRNLGSALAGLGDAAGRPSSLKTSKVDLDFRIIKGDG